jgi:tRNA threonylcarbamoyl adenosine modification protein (Sua5/YciO/YrdC/YwlC family)
MPTTTLITQSTETASATARRAADFLDAGGLVVFPTETVYGVGASALSLKGYAALCDLKNQEEGRPFTVHLPDPAAAERYIDTSSPLLRRLIQKAFPGPVTLVVEVSDDAIQTKLSQIGLPPEAATRLYYQNAIPLRCPDHPLAQAVLGSLSAPVIAGGANRPGEPPARDAAEAAGLDGAVDLVIDGGRTRYAKPSTVVRVRAAVPGSPGGLRVVVEREGVYDTRFIQKLMRWTMLVVCSGNTCRSAMAEGLARQMLAQERGIAPEDLENAGLRVISAGTLAHGGMPAAPEAVESLRKFGVDLTRHRSRSISPEMIHEADVIYCMTNAHRQSVLALSPAAEGKTFLLDPAGDIEDPMGSDLTTYQRCAERLRRRLAQRLKEQQL